MSDLSRTIVPQSMLMEDLPCCQGFPLASLCKISRRGWFFLDPEVLQTRFGVNFLYFGLANVIAREFLSESSANFFRECFGLVSPGFHGPPPQTSRPELSVSLSNFTSLNPIFPPNFLLAGETNLSPRVRLNMTRAALFVSASWPQQHHHWEASTRRLATCQS